MLRNRLQLARAAARCASELLGPELAGADSSVAIRSLSNAAASSSPASWVAAASAPVPHGVSLPFGHAHRQQHGCGGAPRLVRHISFWGGSRVSSSAEQTDASAGQSAELPDGNPMVGASTTAAAEPAVGADEILQAALLAESDAIRSAAEGCWPNVALVETLLVNAHSGLGLPWWEAIAIATMLIRTAALPLAVFGMKNAARVAAAKPEIEQLNARMEELKMRGTYDKQDHMQRMTELWRKHNVNPIRTFVPVFTSGFVFLSFYRAIENLAHAKVPSMVTGGVAWVPDLTSADSTGMLPLICGATLLLSAELGMADGMAGQPAVMQQRMKWLLRGLSVVMPFITYSFPAGIFVYWSTSNLFSLLQGSLFRLPAVRVALGLLPAGGMAAGSPMPATGLQADALSGAKLANLAGKQVQTFSAPPRRHRRKGGKR